MTLCAVQDWREDKCLRLAASLAYYTAFFPAPPLLLTAGVVGLVLGREQVPSQLAAQLESLMGTSCREPVNSILMTTSPEGGTLATVLGLVTLVIGATAFFDELQTTTNLIWEVQPATTNWDILQWGHIRPYVSRLTVRVIDLPVCSRYTAPLIDQTPQPGLRRGPSSGAVC